MPAAGMLSSGLSTLSCYVPAGAYRSSRTVMYRPRGRWHRDGHGAQAGAGRSGASARTIGPASRRTAWHRRRLRRTGNVAVSGAVTGLIGLPVVPVAASADSPQPVSGSAANSAIAQVIGANTTSRMPTRRAVAARSAEAGAPSRRSV